MDFVPLTFGLAELILGALLLCFGYLWKTQAAGIKKAEEDLTKLKVNFAKLEASYLSDTKTIFSTLEEVKESVKRIESHILKNG